VTNADWFLKFSDPLFEFGPIIHIVEITFDPQKSERNRRERGLGFENAAKFAFDSASYAPDNRKDYGETRTRAIGFIEGMLYALVFTMREGALRVISLRRANRKERNRYESSGT
jgi:hypothetical protein